MKRIWSVRINLDEFNSLVGMAFTDRDKAEILVGLAAGMNKAQIPEQCSNGVRAAFESGSRWRSEAEGFQSKQAGAGKASVEARKAKYGDAQPPNGVRTVIEPASNLTLNLNPLTVQPEKRSSPSRARSSRKKDESIPLPEDLVPVVEYLISNWPPVSYEKGSSRSVQIYMRADLWARVAHLASRFGKVPGAVLFCGLPYVRRILKDSEDTGKPVYVKNMSNFWGIKEDNRAWEEAYNQGLVDYNKFKEGK